MRAKPPRPSNAAEEGSGTRCCVTPSLIALGLMQEGHPVSSDKSLKESAIALSLG